MIDHSELSTGKCFITKSNQMRKITKIDVDIDGNKEKNKITYESWSANDERPENPMRVPVSAGKFCADVDRSVKCTYRVGFGQPD